MMSVILSIMVTSSFLPESTGLNISAMMMVMMILMVSLSTPDCNSGTNLNVDCRLCFNMRNTEKHTCQNKNQPDLIFHRYRPVNFIIEYAARLW